MSILVKSGTGKWEKASQARFADEVELQDLLYNSPELIEHGDDGPIVFTKEAALPGSGYMDLIGVAANGDILLVETKLAKNPEIRRKVLGQILEYAAFLWGTEYSDFDQLFVEREGKPLVDLLAERTPNFDADEFKQAVSKNLGDGRFDLLIAVDEMNDELEKVIAYLSSRGSGLKLEALAVRVFTQNDINVLVPQRYGQLNQPPVSPPGSGKKLTIEEILENSQDDHTRELLKFTVDGWAKMGHIIVPGTAGLSCKADVDGAVQPLFWVDPSPSWGIQPLFGSIEHRGCPTGVAQCYRKSVSELQGFPGSRCLRDSRPPAPFPRLTKDVIRGFLELTNEVVQGWRSASTVAPL
jgi:hypothetical protein